MKSKKERKFKVNFIAILIVVLIIVAIVLVILFFKNFMESRFKNMLEKNDSSNYILVQTNGDTVTTIKVYDRVMLSETDDDLIWVSEDENTRIMENKTYETAIITKNPEDELTVATLNETYIKNYFENSQEKFKYIGNEDGFYKIRFKNSKNGLITYIYINTDTKIAEKIVEDFGDAQSEIYFDVTLDCLSKEDVEAPDLEGVYAEYSSNSIVEGNSSDWTDEVEDLTESEEQTEDNDLTIQIEED